MTRPAVYMATNVVNGKRCIGATAIGFEKRRKRHLDRANRDRACPRFYDAIKKYGKESFLWLVLREFDSAPCAFTFERIAISIFRPEYNVTSGGFGTPQIKAWNRRSVICLEDGSIYSSIDEAALAIGGHSGDISCACRGLRKTVKGKHFVFFAATLTKSERIKKIELLDAMAAKSRRRRDLFGLKHAYRGVIDGRDANGRSAAGPMRNARSVKCMDDGKVYESASAAAKAYDVSKSAVIELCLGKNGRRKVSGLTFAYCEAS